jgi:hypothetical protein
MIGYTLILMIEKVIFDSHSHGPEEDDEDGTFVDGDINLINVNNNYNITIPANSGVNGVKELISLNTSMMKKAPSRLSSNLPSKSGSISLCNEMLLTHS